jgi:hypothetical protein
MNPADVSFELLVALASPARPPSLGVVAGGRGDLEDLADRLNRVDVTMGVDELHYLGGRRSSGHAKKTDVRISSPGAAPAALQRADALLVRRRRARAVGIHVGLLHQVAERLLVDPEAWQWDDAAALQAAGLTPLHTSRIARS